ncbi:fructoselysine-6-P-deglycase FrlB-like protein [Knoellia remsis]|uniref:Fructoselysine-6-P-deglycase FrlB-like protein n=1 Tax=Knoellia remsis TaxID=407159 RepID=A0A2T0U803_9MICO|nr:SIS domain-containing protein [Knoellia remsis]PRY53988.1 fructoselysine-6-P-deglycase FrlB-like protein [Knoellia remsis]
MTHLEREIATQPDDWASVVGRLPEVAHLLPQRGERVATIGCGTSWFMGQSYAVLRESLGHGVTDAFAASENFLDRGYDRVVVITRSGTTTEVIEVVDTLRAAGTPHVAIVATPGTPVAEAAESTILLPEVDEQSVVQTRFATTVLALLRASLGDSLDAAISDARAVLAEGDDTAYDGLVDVEQVTFVGRGWTNGIANEAALKLRESVQFWSESYPAMEYRHGPISIAAPGRATWAFGEVPEGLADEVRRTGAHFEHRDIDPMAELVRLQRFCVMRAAKAGIDPDQPRNLTRSIILDDAS